MENLANQELMMKASIFERQAQEIGEKIEYLSQQISELEELNKNLGSLANSDKKEMFSSLARGIYMKSSLLDNNLFVNVGSGVIIKKSVMETKGIIESQLSNFHELKARLMGEMELYDNLLQKTIAELQNQKVN
jgi:prefoldin alpha subunit